MNRKSFFKKLGLVISVIILSVIIGNTGCKTTPDCELYHTGDVTFHDNGPDWAWDGCYIEVDWENGSYTSTVFYNSKTYIDKPAGRADVYMEWEDADYYYYSNGYIDLIECSHVDAYCSWSGKKSETLNNEDLFIIEDVGQILKKNIESIEEFRNNIKN